MKLPIAELRVVEREVDVAPTCPDCDALLTTDGALTCFQWTPQSQEATVDASDDIEWGEYGDLESTEYIPIEWTCTACGAVVLSNEADETEDTEDGDG